MLQEFGNYMDTHIGTISLDDICTSMKRVNGVFVSLISVLFRGRKFFDLFNSGIIITGPTTSTSIQCMIMHRIIVIFKLLDNQKSFDLDFLES